MNTADLIWMNGEFVAWEDAKVHVLTHALHYGTGGVRGRSAPTRLEDGGTAIFRHDDHLRRLRELRAPLLHGPALLARSELREATHELIARNGFKSCYIRPLVFRGYGPMGLNPLDNPVEAMIAVWEWAPYLGEEGKRNGVRAKVSSWRRISPESLIPHSKAGGQYLNSVLAKIESTKARLRGGHPARRARAPSARAPARTSSWSRTARIYTPPPGRRHPRRDQPQVDHPDRARPRARGGRARHRPRRAAAGRRGLPRRAPHAELTPVREIDDLEIGPPGAITRQVQQVVRRRAARARRALRGSGSTSCRYHPRRERAVRAANSVGGRRHTGRRPALVLSSAERRSLNG